MQRRTAPVARRSQHAYRASNAAAFDYVVVVSCLADALVHARCRGARSGGVSGARRASCKQGRDANVLVVEAVE
jgi:hypothetical protein